MAILHSCCCWSNVRTGSIAAGIYSLILSLVNGVLIGYHMVELTADFQSNRENQHEFIRHVQEMTFGWFVSTLVVCFLMFVASVVLIIGIHRDNRFMLVPWMVITIIMVGVDTAAIIYECIISGLLTLNIIQMVVWLGLTILNIYCILCVVSQYQELKAGRGTLEYVRSQRARVVYRGGIQQVHITQGPIVMTYPGGTVQSTVQQNGCVANGSAAGAAPSTASTGTASPAVTATVMMAPPDYDIAASRIPRYSSASTPPEENASAAGETVATERPDVPLLEKGTGTDSPPPPPYQP